MYNCLRLTSVKAYNYNYVHIIIIRLICLMCILYFRQQYALPQQSVSRPVFCVYVTYYILFGMNINFHLIFFLTIQYTSL